MRLRRTIERGESPGDVAKMEVDRCRHWRTASVVAAKLAFEPILCGSSGHCFAKNWTGRGIYASGPENGHSIVWTEFSIIPSGAELKFFLSSCSAYTDHFYGQSRINDEWARLRGTIFAFPFRIFVVCEVYTYFCTNKRNILWNLRLNQLE